MDQRHVSAIFDDIANLLELRRDDPFRIRAYRRAAQALLSVDESLQAVARRGALEDIPGIGRTLASEIDELLDTGRLRYRDHLKSTVPEGLPVLLRLPSLTIQQVRTLWQQHRITSLRELAQAYRADRTPLDAATLAVLGRDLAAWERDEHRMLLGIARPRAEALVQNLAKLPIVQQIEIAGSIRRGRALVRDINIVMASENPEGLIRYCRSQPEVTQILDSRTTSAAILISEGLRVSLTAVPPARFAGALLMGTGSGAHAAALQQRAELHGWRLTEHTAAEEETTLYELLGLPFIPPELRENRGEIEAAGRGRATAAGVTARRTRRLSRRQPLGGRRQRPGPDRPRRPQHGLPIRSRLRRRLFSRHGPRAQPRRTRTTDRLDRADERRPAGRFSPTVRRGSRPVARRRPLGAR